MSNLQPDCDKEQISPLASHLSLRSRLGCLPSRSVKTCNALRGLFVLENESLWLLGPSHFVCAHGTTILTNREPSKLIGESAYFMPSRLGHGLLYSRKIGRRIKFGDLVVYITTAKLISAKFSYSHICDHP